MYELLLGRDRRELINLTISLGMEPLHENAQPKEWARHLAEGFAAYGENLLLMLTSDETEALMALTARSLQVSRAEADEDGSLLVGLMKLADYGLAEETGECWEVAPQAAGLLKLSEAELAQQRMQDELYDYMQGWLLHVGMMPVDELTARAVALVEPDTQDEREALEQLCQALLIARGGIDGMYLDEYEEPWHVHSELEEPEDLLERLRMPFLAKLPYPDFDPDALAIAGGISSLAGSIRLYRPLLDFLEAQGVEDVDDAVMTAALMIQNEKAEDVITMLQEDYGIVGFSAAERLADLVTDLSNAMPRWYNKGYSPDEMARRMPGRKKTMPGRNDPCPCGSGRKYKVCCGRHVN